MIPIFWDKPIIQAEKTHRRLYNRIMHQSQMSEDVVRIGKMICISPDLIWQLPVIYTDIGQITSGLNFSQPRCVFHQVTFPSASGRNSFFPDGFAPDSRCSGASFYGQKRPADTVEERPPAKLQSGTLPENFKFTAISIIQWPALGRQLLMKGEGWAKMRKG